MENQSKEPRIDADVPPEGGVVRILVVEDEAPVRELLQAILEEADYAVSVADTGDAALEIVQNQKKAFDLVISDVMLPGLKGNELIGRLKQTHHELRTLYVTGYSYERLLNSGPKDEETRVLKKPFSPDDLLQAVSEVLNS